MGVSEVGMIPMELGEGGGKASREINGAIEAGNEGDVRWESRELMTTIVVNVSDRGGE